MKNTNRSTKTDIGFALSMLGVLLATVNAAPAAPDAASDLERRLNAEAAVKLVKAVRDRETTGAFDVLASTDGQTWEIEDSRGTNDLV